MSLKNVLIIDDSKLDAILAKKILEKHQFADNVLLFERAMDALDYLTAFDLGRLNDFPQVIFLDVLMPEMNAQSFLENFLKLPASLRKDVTFVIMSSAIQTEIDENAFANYPHKIFFISKPISEDVLQKVHILYRA
jgi:CheY-like chemotaxis protein